MTESISIISPESSLSVASPRYYEDLRRGVFISDLHMFSSRSDAEQCVEMLQLYQEECDAIILGGDIFDLRWSQMGGLQPTIDCALNWLHQLLDTTGRSRIIYLAGNHDCHPEFASEMKSFALSCERFDWFEHGLQIQDCLFFHGDILHAGLRSDDLLAYRQKHHREESPHQLMHHFYDLAVRLRLHTAVARMGNSPRATCQRLQNLVGNLEGQPERLVERVFFGHTHVAIPGMEFGDQVFFNPGAMLKHSRHFPIHFDF